MNWKLKIAGSLKPQERLVENERKIERKTDRETEKRKREGDCMKNEEGERDKIEEKRKRRRLGHTEREQEREWDK